MKYWMSVFRFGVFGVLCFAAARWARADAPFLKPDAYVVTVGALLRLQIQEGVAERTRPAEWPGSALTELVYRHESGQANFDAIAPRAAQDDFVSVQMTDAGGTLLAVTLRDTTSNLSAAALREQLPKHTVVSNAPMPAGPTRVRRIAAAKLVVRVMDPQTARERPTGSAVVTSKTGQPAEIRALADPSTMRVGSDLPLRIYAEGGAVPEGKVVATSVDTGVTAVVVTDRSGIGHLHVASAGEYRLQMDYAAPDPQDPSAGWAWYTATLVFSVPAEEEGRP